MTIQWSFLQGAGGEMQMLRGVSNTSKIPPKPFSCLSWHLQVFLLKWWICRHGHDIIPWWEAELILSTWKENSNNWLKMQCRLLQASPIPHTGLGTDGKTSLLDWKILNKSGAKKIFHIWLWDTFKNKLWTPSHGDWSEIPTPYPPALKLGDIDGLKTLS